MVVPPTVTGDQASNCLVSVCVCVCVCCTGVLVPPFYFLI
jgi:hypothetical protein